jgi:predicted esterase YcpF (UPF0227 family)
MLGTIPAPGDLSMLDLGGYLTTKEQLNFAQLTALTVDPAAGSTRNMATYIDQPAQLGAITIVAKGASSEGTKILSTTAFISGTKTDIDLYRLPLA